MTVMLQCRQLMMVYRVGDSEVIALQGLELDLRAGEMLGVVGSSGSGKSTLLSVVSGLVRPTGGSVTFDGLDLGAASTRQLDTYRQVDLGFLWQDAARNLVPHLTAAENVALPLAMHGAANASDCADTLLQRVGLATRGSHRPRELSGGEQQRVALAVALAHQPRLLLADEPTGELDSSTTEQIFSLMREIGEETGLAQIIVSHDTELARHVDRVISLQDGRVAAERWVRAGQDGATEVVEATVIDSIGRLQLTAEQQEVVGQTGRVHAELVEGELRIRPAEPGPQQ